MTELLVNRYRIQERVGSGQQGSVYRAHDTLLDRLVALKMIQGVSDSVGLDETLRREALLLAKFEHPNVVRVYDVVTDIRGQSVIVMELLDGEPLSKCIGTLSKEEVLNFVKQICGAMQVAHQAGLLHRDLKPGNIMFQGRNTPRERFVILDMGIGKFTARGENAGSSLEQTCAGAGTPLYMAPEQWHGESGDARTDIYALGSILYEVYAGTAPLAHHGQNLMNLMNAVVHEPPQCLMSRSHARPLSAEMNQLILNCLKKDPTQRPQSMKDVLNFYVAALENVPWVQPEVDPDEFRTRLPGSVQPIPSHVDADKQRSASSSRAAQRADGAGLAVKVFGILGVVLVFAFVIYNALPPESAGDPRGSGVVNPGDVTPALQPVTTLTATEKLKRAVEEHGGQLTISEDSRANFKINVPLDQLTPELVSVLFDAIAESGSSYVVSSAELELALLQSVPLEDHTILQLDVSMSKSKDRIGRAMNVFNLADRLGSFVVSYNREFTDAYLESLLGRQTHLEQLILSDTGIGATIPTIDPAAMKLLRVLDLGGNIRVGGPYVSMLTASAALEELKLADTGIEDDDLKAIPYTRLRVLDLTNTAVSNKGVATIVALGAGTLETVLLGGTSIDDEAIESLAKLRKLMVLNVGTQLKAEGLERLRGLLPEVAINED